MLPFFFLARNQIWVSPKKQAKIANNNGGGIAIFLQICSLVNVDDYTVAIGTDGIDCRLNGLELRTSIFVNN